MASRIQDANQAATALESYFLRRVLSEVKTSEEGLLGGGFAGGMFKEMFDEAIADSMSAAGGIGIGQTVAQQLDPAAAAKSKHPAPATEAPSVRSHAQPLDLHTHTAALRPETADSRVDTPAVQPASVAIRRAYQSAQSASEAPSSLSIRGRTTDGR